MTHYGNFNDTVGLVGETLLFVGNREMNKDTRMMVQRQSITVSVSRTNSFALLLVNNGSPLLFRKVSTFIDQRIHILLPNKPRKTMISELCIEKRVHQNKCASTTNSY